MKLSLTTNRLNIHNINSVETRRDRQQSEEDVEW